MKRKILITGVASALLSVMALPLVARAASNVAVNFESPSYVLGNIHGQDGWMKTGTYDSVVGANTSGSSSFGSQSLRISNSVTSGSFGDQTFAKPLADSVGESVATAGSFSAGTKQPHFEMQFDVASAVPSSEQPGLAISMSPDRGDGSRMSYLRFDDTPGGINVTFFDVTGTTSPVSFNPTQIATGLNRSVPHNIKMTLDVVEGPSNDVVKVWIDGSLVITGTSWENYYRYDAEAAAEQTPRVVKTVIFRAGGAAAPATAGNGFLFDNINLSSGPIPPVLVGPPTTKEECRNQGWRTFNNPTFRNREKCIDYVVRHSHEVEGEVRYEAFGLRRYAEFEMNTADSKGYFKYSDANGDWYKVKVSKIKVSDDDGYFAGEVTHASNPSWVGNWLFARVEDKPDKIWGDFATEAAAKAGVDAMTSPASGPFNVTRGNLKVK